MLAGTEVAEDSRLEDYEVASDQAETVAKFEINGTWFVFVVCAAMA